MPNDRDKEYESLVDALDDRLNTEDDRANIFSRMNEAAAVAGKNPNVKEQEKRDKGGKGRG